MRYKNVCMGYPERAEGKTLMYRGVIYRKKQCIKWQGRWHTEPKDAARDVDLLLVQRGLEPINGLLKLKTK